jgi:hypothetical protein
MTSQRASATVVATKAGIVYTNTHSGPQVVTLSVHSDNNTTNPAINVAVDSVKTRTLNFIGTRGTLAQAPVSGELDLATLNGSPYAGNRVTMNTAVAMPPMGGNGTYYSSFNNNNDRAFMIDPYFWVNPSAFNQKSDTRYVYNYGATAYLKYAGNAKDTRDQFLDYRMTSATWNATAGTNLATASLTYDGGPLRASCLYTDTAIATQTSGYMSMVEFTSDSTSRVGSRSSNSFYYNYTGSSYNPISYHFDDNYRINVRTDGGMYVMDYYPSSNSNRTYKLAFIDAMTFKGGAGKYSNAQSSYSQTDLISDTIQPWHARVTVNNTPTGNLIASWMKYHAASDKYYLYFYGGNSAYNGIWETTRSSLFPGDGNTNDHNSIEEAFTKVSGTTGLTGNFATTQPQQIGASLWVAFTASSAWYSTNLINWKTAPDFIGESGASEATHVFELNGRKVFAESGSPILKGLSSGFSNVDSSGRLENGTAVGVYERNGIILNSGDSIYLENLDISTDVHSTVMALDI